MPTAVFTDPLIGTLLADRYRVQRLLGEGGMGRVYLAEHERMGRLSAVKIMSPSLAATPEAISRFNREAANASRIHQPNVAAIYDFGETADGTMYLAMEYVEGETLTSLLRREAPLAPARAAELTGQIADGLTAAHHLGIIHRDLKPDNILVTRNLQGREWAKIVDFGIAKTTQKSDQTVTSLGVAIGTPEYMSPEQIAGEPLDPRTDLYSLGLVLFNMLTGGLPHPAMTSKQSLVQRLTARPRSLAEVRPNVAWPPRLQKALDRALAPEPDERYSNVGDFARDVRGAAGMPLYVSTEARTTIISQPRSTSAVDAAPAPLSTPVSTSGARPIRKSSGGGVLVALLLLLIAGGAGAAVFPHELRSLLGEEAPVPRNAGMAHHAASDSSHAVVPAGLPANATPMDSASLAAQQAADTAAHKGVSGPLSPIDPGLRLRTAAMGDSSHSLAGPAVMATVDDDVKEIMVHVNRARELSRANQLDGAGLELRTAYQEYRIFITEHASAPQKEGLARDLQTAMDEALNACHVARDSVVAHGGHSFRCEHPAKTGVLVVPEDDAPTPPRVP
ncbi:MAG: putative serine/threonine protein kinase [Gemmatimonadetes bacterium]|nr:putative serine/threonine protein kinase [Gemmatimonadota bacterium]